MKIYPHRTNLFARAAVFAALGGSVAIAQANPGDVSPVSVSAFTLNAAGLSGAPAVSDDGRYVAFTSQSTIVVRNDTNGVVDVFVRDLQSGTTERVSVSSSGTQANDFSYSPAISADGRYVAFASNASNLVPNDTNNTIDVFVRDRQSGTTQRVTVDSNGVEANDQSDDVAISGNGRYVAFRSDSSNLVPGDTTGWDVFVHDLQTGTTEKVSVSSSGVAGNNFSQLPSLSADGRYVAFQSSATNLVADGLGAGGFVRDRQTGTTSRFVGTPFAIDSPQISPDGRFVSFSSFQSNLVPGDSNNAGDVFVYDRQTAVLERVSVDSNGVQGNGESNLLARAPISAGGRFVAFTSVASNLVPGDTNNNIDVFIRDRTNETTQRVSLDANGAQIPYALTPDMTPDGLHVVFVTKASLASNDLNTSEDVYTRELAQAAPLAFTLKPSALDFGKLAQTATSASLAATIQNKTAGSLPIDSLTIGGQNPGQFAFTSNCGSSVPVDGSCTINVVFKPTNVGIKNASLNVQSGAESHSTTLTGEGVATSFTLTPSSLNFGSVTVGSVSARKWFTITNTSQAAMPIRGIGIGGTDPTQFTFNTGCGKSLAAGAICKIGVLFKPTSLGVKTATITVRVVGGAAPKTVTVTGQGS